MRLPIVNEDNWVHRRFMGESDAWTAWDRDNLSSEDYKSYTAAMRHRAMLKAIKPLLDAKADAMARMLPSVIIFADGTQDCQYSVHDQCVLARYDDIIREAIALL